MKWFKHLSGSLNDSFVFSLIQKFGGDGYMTFFGILELMTDEFDINNPGISQFPVRKLTKNLQISTKKLTNILNFITEKGRIIATFSDDEIVLNCPRLKELMDEYTARKLYKNIGTLSGQSPEKIHKEVEVEVEVDKEEVNTSCPELSKDIASEHEIIFIELLLNDKTKFKVTESFVTEKAELYPSVDIRQEFRNMKDWLDSNPTRRKTRSGIKRFITLWLSKRQNIGGRNIITQKYSEEKIKELQ